LYLQISFSNLIFRSHGLTLTNELILTMIEKESDWERILTENIIQFDEEVWRKKAHLSDEIILELFASHACEKMSRLSAHCGEWLWISTSVLQHYF
jgi:hypothetical protein